MKDEADILIIGLIAIVSVLGFTSFITNRKNKK
jgi:hypothetical protein